MNFKTLWDAFDAADDPKEPRYDPLHLGAALVLTLLAMGALYWLLWTLLVFEGGLTPKLLPALQVLLRLKPAAAFGYRGPWDRGVFEGWLGNAAALAACAAVMTALHRLYHAAAANSRRR